MNYFMTSITFRHYVLFSTASEECSYLSQASFSSLVLVIILYYYSLVVHLLPSVASSLLNIFFNNSRLDANQIFSKSFGHLVFSVTRHEVGVILDPTS